MIVLAGGDLVLPDRVIPGGSIAVDGGRIVAIEPRASIDPAGARIIDVSGTCVVPGFVDVHVHGVGGLDTLGAGSAVAGIAARLARYGVTSFCPTSVACDPVTLRTFLAQVGLARGSRSPRSARVLPAHLESNFINPEYCGAQPVACLRVPAAAASPLDPVEAGGFAAAEILDAIEAARADVGIVTLAPELPGGIDLLRRLVGEGIRVSLGHSGADFEIANSAIDAGARHATHLFNRMTPMTHRSPGLTGAVLARDEIAAELICDGYHVHPAAARVAIAAKRIDRIMAITDGTAVAGLPVGSRATLGSQVIYAAEHAARLADGTLAGSTLTMDRAFRNLVTGMHCTVVDAAAMCATTPARELGMTGFGVIAEGAVADLVVLDRALTVVHTLIDGEFAFSRDDARPAAR